MSTKFSGSLVDQELHLPIQKVQSLTEMRYAEKPNLKQKSLCTTRFNKDLKNGHLEKNPKSFENNYVLSDLCGLFHLFLR